MFVYDINSRRSFKYLDNFIHDINDSMILVLVGINNSQLLKFNVDNNQEESKDEEREVSYDEGLKYAMKHGMAFFEISIKDGINVNNAFEYIIYKLIERRDNEKEHIRVRSRPRIENSNK